MKRLLTILLIVLITAPQIIAQDKKEKLPKAWNLAEFQFRWGGYEDHYNNLNLEGYQSMTRNADLSSYLGTTSYSDVYVSAISGGNIGFSATLNPYSKKKEAIRKGQSLRFGVSMNMQRESMISYTREVYNTNQSYLEYREATFCMVENEFLMESAYLFSTNKSRVVSVYGGAGGSLGFTFGNEMLVFGNDVLLEDEAMHEYKAKNSTYLRLNAIMGLNVRLFRGFGMFMESQTGGGWQFVHSGGDTYSIETCSFFMGFNFDMRHKRK